MSQPLPPLRLAPIFQSRIWGGRRFADLFGWTLPDGPIGEAWLLSDRDDFPSRIADGPCAGQTLRQLLAAHPADMLGRHHGLERFPLLLKFLDARDDLSIQVHPSDDHKEYLPPGERGKTEAWLVLDAVPGSKIYAGVQPGLTDTRLRTQVGSRSLAAALGQFHPQPGDGVFLPAGTLHALGAGVAVFEVQQNSDVTFRLDDWGRVDAKTGQPRELHVEQSLACTDFARGPLAPLTPVSVSADGAERELLFQCEFFQTWRLRGQKPFALGRSGEGRVLVGIEGASQLQCSTGTYPVNAGDTFLLPASLGACICAPVGAATVLEIALPE